jgi:hypothetical protein
VNLWWFLCWFCEECVILRWFLLWFCESVIVICVMILLNIWLWIVLLFFEMNQLNLIVICWWDIWDIENKRKEKKNGRRVGWG